MKSQILFSCVKLSFDIKRGVFQHSPFFITWLIITGAFDFPLFNKLFISELLKYNLESLFLYRTLLEKKQRRSLLGRKV